MFCPKCGSELEDGAKFCDKCGAPVSEEPEKKAKGHGKLKKILPVMGTLAVLSAVVVVTVNMTKGFLGEINKEDTSAPVTSSVISAGAGASRPDGTDKTDDRRGKQLAKLFAETYSSEWKVKKYSENGQSWSTYDLGKKMAICAFNFLNDKTFSSGGFYLHTRDKTEYRATGKVNVRYYEWVPERATEIHGKDIYYDCPQITITANSVDMRGMGGSVYSIDDFRYELSDSGNDRIVNDKLKFALEYDGRYLNYKEPDAYGYYMGYYAYDTADSLVNITYIHDRSEFKSY